MSTSILLCTAALALVQDGDGVMDRLSFYANGRLRAESTFDQLSGEDRHRGRMRFRIGARYRIEENLRAEARLSSASDGRDANNPHWDFGDGADGFQGIDVVFDRFFLEYEPCDELQLRGGKFPQAFARPPVYGEFTWDDDVHPAGFSAVWDPEEQGDLDFDLRAMEVVVAENGSADDPNMFGVQANLAYQAAEDTALALSSSMSWWSSLGAGVAGNQGNTTTGGDFDADFSVWDSFLSVRHEGGVMERQQAFVQYVDNVDDDTGEDMGFAAGFELGKRDPGDTSLFLAYYDFDANAFFSAVAQDDTPLAGSGTGSGMSGFIGGLRHVVSKRLSLRLWALSSDADDVEDPLRVRLDLDFNVL